MRRREVLGALVASLASTAACNVVARARTRKRRQAQRAGASSVTLVRGTDRIHAWVHGKGDPVLLLHGFGASALVQWENQLHAWADEFRLVAPDLLWFGESVSSSPDPSLEHQAQAMIAAVEALVDGPVHLLGLSYGGFVASEVQRLRPDLVRTRTMVDSPGRAWSRTDHEALLQRLGVESTAEVFVPSSTAELRRLLALVYTDPPWIPDVVAKQVLEEIYDPRREQLTSLLTYLERNLEQLVQQSVSAQFPHLVVWGEDDPIFPLETGRRLAQLEHGELHVIDDTRHLPVLEATESFNDVVRGFLRRHRQT